MDNERSSFSDDLESIQTAVEADVGTILKLAKRQNELDPQGLPRIKKSNSPTKRAVRPVLARTKSRRLVTTEPQPKLLQNVATRLSLETNSLLTEAASRPCLNNPSRHSRRFVNS